MFMYWISIYLGAKLIVKSRWLLFIVGTFNICFSKGNIPLHFFSFPLFPFLLFSSLFFFFVLFFLSQSFFSRISCNLCGDNRMTYFVFSQRVKLLFICSYLSVDWRWLFAMKNIGPSKMFQGRSSFYFSFLFLFKFIFIYLFFCLCVILIETRIVCMILYIDDNCIYIYVIYIYI